jgi:NADH-quinone oxidoreductase subunit H
MFFIVLFVLVRGTLPRYRYDQLMRLGWKIFLPLGLALFLAYASLILVFNSGVELIW